MKRRITAALLGIFAVVLFALLVYMTKTGNHYELTAFSDVPEDHWAYEEIQLCLRHGAVRGTSGANANGEGRYAPSETAKLGEFVAALTRLLCPEEIEETAVPWENWALGNYEAALRVGLLTEEELSRADLKRDLTREDMALLLYSAAAYSGETLEADPKVTATVTDADAISPDRRERVLRVYSNGILNGCDGGAFEPAQTVDRAQMAATICRLMRYVPRLEAVFPDDLEESAIDFRDVLERVNEERLVEMHTVPDEIQAISLSDEYEDLLSDAECEMLLTEKPMQETVTREAAIEDAEYFWKAFASAYGGYYYFGDDAFREAHRKVVAALEEMPDWVEIGRFEELLYDAYSFIRDDHVRFSGIEYLETFYVKGWYFYKSADGYYCLIDGEKWYLTDLDGKELEDYLRLTIADSGELVYGLYSRAVLASDETLPAALTVARVFQTRTVPLTWTESQALGWEEADSEDNFYATTNMDGHNVIKVRQFGYFDSDRKRELLEDFMQTGYTLSGQDYVIIDSRSNGGGGNGSACAWMNRFLGNTADIEYRPNQLDSSSVSFGVFSRLLRIARGDRQMELTRTRDINIAQQTENTHPLFVLTDYLSGSAGEGIITMYRTVKNVLIIGTNTRGCMFGNVELTVWLPNSGYGFSFGPHATLEDFQNREGYGYDPDIWVPSEYALELTLKLCDYYGLTDPDTTPLPDVGQAPARVSLEGYTG